MNILSKEQIKKSYVKKAKIFGFIGLGVLVLFLLLSIAGFAGAGEEENSGDSSSGIACIICGFISAIPLFILCLVNLSKSKGQKLDDAYAKHLSSIEKDKIKSEEVKAKQEKELASISADFTFDKTIKIDEDQLVWFDVENKLVQFLLKAKTENQKKISVTKHKKGFLQFDVQLFKTHVYNANDFKSVELLCEQQCQEHSSETRTSGAWDAGVTITSTSREHTNVFELQIRTNDIDFPIIVINFGTDGVTPDTIKSTIEMLQNK